MGNASFARPFNFPVEIASPILPRTPDDWIEQSFLDISIGRYQCIMSFSKRACTDSPHLWCTCFLLPAWPYWQRISFTEMMMETKCHSVMCTTFYKSFVNGTYHLTCVMVHHNFCDWSSTEFCIIFNVPLKYFFSCHFQGISSEYLFQLYLPSYRSPCIRLMLLQAPMVLFAPS